MCLSEVISEDPRYLEREAPPLSEEFPDGSKIFFLGEHAYGVAAQVSATTNTTLSVILAVRIISGCDDLRTKNDVDGYIFSSSPLNWPRMINSRLWSIIASGAVIIPRSRRRSKLASPVGRWARSPPVSWLSHLITRRRTSASVSNLKRKPSRSSITRARKDVIGIIARRLWTFSKNTKQEICHFCYLFSLLILGYRKRSQMSSAFSIGVGMVRFFVFRTDLTKLMFGVGMAKASEIFSGPEPDGKVKEVKHWLKAKGVRDFEPVSLFCDQLTKVRRK